VKAAGFDDTERSAIDNENLVFGTHDNGWMFGHDEDTVLESDGGDDDEDDDVEGGDAPPPEEVEGE
jgi:hypothetical protein